jgi:hypothetical protein
MGRYGKGFGEARKGNLAPNYSVFLRYDEFILLLQACAQRRRPPLAR